MKAVPPLCGVLRLLIPGGVGGNNSSSVIGSRGIDWLRRRVADGATGGGVIGGGGLPEQGIDASRRGAAEVGAEEEIAKGGAGRVVIHGREGSTPALPVSSDGEAERRCEC